VNTADWIAVVVITLAAFGGMRRGLVTSVLSLAGLVVGAVVGARIAPALVGDGSAYVPLVALGGVAAGATIGHTLGNLAGRSARNTLAVLPPLRILDSAGGGVLGLAFGLAICWSVGAVILYLPGQTELRRLAQESDVVSSLTVALPPERVMDALGRIDPFSVLAGPSAGVPPPEPAIARDPDVRAARASVVRIRGIACGLGVEGSGWIVRKGLVVTNAHVVAGVDTPVVDRRGGRTNDAQIVAFDARNDIAVLRVRGLRGRALELADPERGDPAALLGFPGNGPFRVTPVRLGRTARLGARDAYGRLQLQRPIVALRGDVRSGNSGGPVVDAEGRVVATVFAQRRGSDDGYAVPNAQVRSALGNIGSPLETSCVGR
jgi:trypsin-like peptidase/colicin V production protein